MTDKLSEFFKDIKDRLASPFFSSFIIAWIVINWKIPIALLWYNQAELQKIGYKSHFDLISKSYDAWYFIGAPLLSALIYCLLFPFVKYSIMIVQAKIRTWGTKEVFEASKESPVTVEKYYEQKGKYENLKAELSQLISTESIHKNANQNLTKQVASLEREKNDYLERLKDWTNRQNPLLLNGKYQLTFIDSNGKKAARNVLFRDEEFYIFNKAGQSQTFYCFDFFLNPDTNNMAMYLKSKETDAIIFQFLHLENQNIRKFEGVMLFASNKANVVLIDVADDLVLGTPLKVEYIAETLLRGQVLVT